MRMPSIRSLIRCLLLAVCWGALGGPARADDSALVRKTVKGITFTVPEDWPIEERNGAVGPIPIEEYLARKFSAIQAQLQKLDQQLSGLDLRLRVVEQAAEARNGGLRSAETPR